MSTLPPQTPGTGNDTTTDAPGSPYFLEGLFFDAGFDAGQQAALERIADLEQQLAALQPVP